MNPQINEEVVLLLMSMYCGIVMALSYDCIRIFRKIVEPSIVRVIIEDIIYWIIVAYFAFDIIVKYNYGNVRWFSIAAMFATIILYEIILGKRLVNFLASIIDKILKTLLKPLKKALKGIKLAYIKVSNKKKKNKSKLGNKVSKWREKKKRKATADEQPQLPE